MNKQSQADWVAPPPGSWSFDGPPNNHIVWSGPETRVCFLTSDGPATKNAQLIAAAPDLLAALEEVCDWIAGCLAADDSSMPDADMLRETERIATSARAAIAKATGEQP